MEEQLIQDIEQYLGAELDSCDQSALLFCAKRAILSFKNQRDYPDYYAESVIQKDMEKKKACLLDVLIFWCEKQGLIFQKSHSENGVNMTFESEDEIYARHHILPIGRIV